MEERESVGRESKNSVEIRPPNFRAGYLFPARIFNFANSCINDARSAVR